MKVLVVYESMYGNTREVAEAIARGARTDGVVDIVPASDASESDIASYDLLVVGGPTHVHGMSRPRTRDGAIEAASKPESTLHLEADAAGPGIREWLNTLDHAPCPAAVFDTRVDRSPLLTGRASKTIAKRLRRSGFELFCEPESFLVDDNTKLEPGEVSRAEAWGRSLSTSPSWTVS